MNVLVLCRQRFLGIILLVSLLLTSTAPAIAQTAAAQRDIPASYQTPTGVQSNNLPVPMVHQVWDTVDSFDGNWACGPTSAVMALAYYQKIPARAITINSGGSHTNDYGFYVSNIYDAYGNRFTRSMPDASGRPAQGSYGHGTDNACGGPCGVAWRIQDYIEKHGVATEFSGRWNTTAQQDIDFVRQQIDRGYLVLAAGSFNGLAHIVLVRGYTDDGQFIINDPYGNPLIPSTYGRQRNGENITVGFGNNLREISWMIVVKGVREVSNATIEADNQVLTLGSTLNSTIAPNNDEDTFWFDGNAGTNIKINMSAANSSIDTYLTLFTPDGRLLKYNDDANGSTNSEIAVSLPSSGRYKIIANSYNRASSGNYTIALAQLAASNADTDDQRWLPLETPIEGTISPNSDLDTYYFSGSANSVVNIRMNKIDASLDSWLDLYAPSGTRLTSDDDGGGSYNSWIAFRLPANGTYRIVARSWNAASNGRYKIRVSADRNNFALSADTDSSSEDSALNSASLATDGNSRTAWISGAAISQTLRVDLGEVKQLDQAIIRWGAGFATDYGVYYQDTNGDWQPTFATQSGDGDVDIVNFSPIQARYISLAMWGHASLYDSYEIQEFEMHDNSSILIPLVPPGDESKPEETNVTPLVPLAPEPEGKDAQSFALGADQESFPLADEDGAIYAPTLQITDTYRPPTVTLNISNTILWAGTTLTATAVNAHDQDNNQVGNGIIAYRWLLVDTVNGPSGYLTTPIGDQPTLEIADSDKLQPGTYRLALQVQDDEGSWSEIVSQLITVPNNIFLPLVSK